MIEKLKALSKQLLKEKRVDVILAYKRASNGVSAMPHFVMKEEDVDSMVLDSYCIYNLATYIKDYPKKKVGIVVKSCDMRSVVVLMQENRIKREDVVIIGAECHGVVDEKRSHGSDMAYDSKCGHCKMSVPVIYDHLIEEKTKSDKKPKDGDEYDSVRKMGAKSLEERLKFWENEFSRCIRCYACRQVCPMCYCPKCVADQTTPAWFSKAAELKGNTAWNITRAIHLAGRCISCGECERVCPVGIPLMELNKKIEKDIREMFGYEAGKNVDAKPLFASFDKSDPDNFIR